MLLRCDAAERASFRDIIHIPMLARLARSPGAGAGRTRCARARLRRCHSSRFYAAATGAVTEVRLMRCRWPLRQFRRYLPRHARRRHASAQSPLMPLAARSTARGQVCRVIAMLPMQFLSSRHCLLMMLDERFRYAIGLPRPVEANNRSRHSTKLHHACRATCQ